jgi:hypothetical protein
VSAFARGTPLFLLLLGSWILARLLVSAWFTRRLTFGAELMAQALAVAALQWVLLRGWRRPA